MLRAQFQAMLSDITLTCFSTAHTESKQIRNSGLSLERKHLSTAFRSRPDTSHGNGNFSG